MVVVAMLFLIASVILFGWACVQLGNVQRDKKRLAEEEAQRVAQRAQSPQTAPPEHMTEQQAALDRMAAVDDLFAQVGSTFDRVFGDALSRIPQSGDRPPWTTSTRTTVVLSGNSSGITRRPARTAPRQPAPVPPQPAAPEAPTDTIFDHLRKDDDLS